MLKYKITYLDFNNMNGGMPQIPADNIVNDDVFNTFENYNQSKLFDIGLSYDWFGKLVGGFFYTGDKAQQKSSTDVSEDPNFNLDNLHDGITFNYTPDQIETAKSMDVKGREKLLEKLNQNDKSDKLTNAIKFHILGVLFKYRSRSIYKLIIEDMFTNIEDGSVDDEKMSIFLGNMNQ